MDTCRSGVYAAEKSVRRILENSLEFPTVEMFGSTFTLPSERKFASIESVQTYVDKVLALNWVRAEFPNANKPVKVRERKGSNFAHYQACNATIAICSKRGDNWAMREIVVLHELSHHFARDGHGPKFCHAFLTLVSGLIGEEVAFILRCLLHSEGVKVA